MAGKIAIVAEGGGQRGIYTAGVLDAFLERSFNPFDLGIGVSAGAQNLLSYFLEQPDYARRAVTELTSRDDFLVLSRFFTAHSILDLDGYFDSSVHHPEYTLPYRQISRVRQHRQLLFVATDSASLSPIYLEPNENNIVNCLKASSAVPFLYRNGVNIDRRVLIDGGVAEPLPIQHAYDLGARYIVVIRTECMASSQPCAEPWGGWLRRISRLPLRSNRILQMLYQRHKAMVESSRFLCNPPLDLNVHIIAPDSPLKSQTFSSKPDCLAADYQQGLNHGRRALAR